MRLTLERDRREQAERLLADLKAIEQWNTAYWRNSDPDVYETSAFLSRESRRSEIILQIAVVPQSLLKMPAGGKVCPYCEGKGYVLDQALTHDGNTKTWTRRDCPLCDGHWATLRRSRANQQSPLSETKLASHPRSSLSPHVVA